MRDIDISKVLSNEAIVRRAEEKWNKKDETKRIRAGNKYRHIFQRFRMPENDWRNKFSDLTESQKNILIKGELIRTYDSLPNLHKTVIKREIGLSSFSTKWFKLAPCDKKMLLSYVVNEKE